MESGWNLASDSKKFSITFSPSLYDLLTKKAKSLDITTAQAVRDASTQWVDNQVENSTERVDQSKHITDLQDQLVTKDQQIERLQSTLDQSQQLHAMSEKRHESELAKIEGRSFLQRLKAVLVANP